MNTNTALTSALTYCRDISGDVLRWRQWWLTALTSVVTYCIDVSTDVLRWRQRWRTAVTSTLTYSSDVRTDVFPMQWNECKIEWVKVNRCESFMCTLYCSCKTNVLTKNPSIAEMDAQCCRVEYCWVRIPPFNTLCFSSLKVQWFKVHLKTD